MAVPVLNADQAAALRDLIRNEVLLVLKAVSPALATAYERNIRKGRVLKGASPPGEPSDPKDRG